MPGASPVGVSAAASRALALATEDGIAGDVGAICRRCCRGLQSASASLSVAGFHRHLAGSAMRRGFFQWREPCLAYLLSATGAPACLRSCSRGRVVSVAAARDGPAKHTKTPLRRINAERPLALIFIWQSPHLPAPESEMRPSRRVRSGAKKGNLRAVPGESRATTMPRWSSPLRRSS